ncbi:MAG: hypothetical protein C4520_10025 [Candidatus Abyssobacteria bacterium SURF_5]|uniref:Uncharacterized protein n=1 Tax=Abyssobacteria bacterium (strain SURF_5) TaxID=2093360 RepID=A0A3A4NQP2_ABYX5|nr:MAG: hypothetical protein C4520_10025 [Candidatus Abyssubacteria bacterium SURF_5]
MICVLVNCWRNGWAVDGGSHLRHKRNLRKYCEDGSFFLRKQEGISIMDVIKLRILSGTEVK